MIEPLLALTVLNCFFMFSSSVTTCALWWQYRSHRCCFARNSPRRSAETNCGCGFPRKKMNGGAGDSGTTVYRHRSVKSKKQQRQRRNPVDVEQRKIVTTTEARKGAKETREARKEIREVRAPVLLEISTVRKVVQVMEDGEDLSQLSIGDLVSRRIVPDRDKRTVVADSKDVTDAALAQ